MNMGGRLNKPKTKPTKQKKPAPDPDQSPKKELLQRLGVESRNNHARSSLQSKIREPFWRSARATFWENQDLIRVRSEKTEGLE
jgi:hypothetical protein